MAVWLVFALVRLTLWALKLYLAAIEGTRGDVQEEERNEGNWIDPGFKYSQSSNTCLVNQPLTYGSQNWLYLQVLQGLRDN